jgi:hypothetical protein
MMHFVAYRVHVEGTNRGKYIFQIESFSMIYNKFNAENVLIFKYSF